MSIKENLIKWIRMFLFDFHEKLVVKYLKAFEKLFRRFYFRYAVLDKKDRRFFENKLSDFFYEIHGNFVSYIYPPCEPTFKKINEDYKNNPPYIDCDSYIHPFADPNLTEVINRYILNNLNIILNKYYPDNNFKENECYDEFEKFKKVVEELEEFTEKEFNKLRGKPDWILGIDQIIDSNFDFSITVFCRVLSRHKEILSLLNEEEKKRLKTIAEIWIKDEEFPNGTPIASYVSDCCDKIGLDYEKKFVSLDKIDEYFDPKKNPFEFKI